MQKVRLPSLQDAGDLKGKYVVLRTDVNVPLEDGEVRNQFRIMRSLPTINYLAEQGARVILIAHLQPKEPESLKPVYDVLTQHVNIQWCEETVGEKVTEAKNALQDGEVLMVENLRFDPREKKNDPDFVKALAGLGEVYVNDAFSVSHRAHASLVGIPHYLPSYFGMNFIHEYQELHKVLVPEHPSLFMLGGAKFDTKMPLVEKFLDTYDHVFVGGALANDFFKAMGFEIGQSMVSEVDLSGSPLLTHSKILLPVDVTVRSDAGVRTCAPDDVKSNEIILDAGPDTAVLLGEYIKDAKTILWNGPFGDYEHGFETQTLDVAKHIADSEGYSLVGGGDTVAAIESLSLQGKFGFLSTAGGAMLTFLELSTLPAIEAVMNKKTGE